MSYKKYEKVLTNEEFDERKLKGYELIKSYNIGFEGETHEIELEIEKDIYDEYKIGVFSNGKIKKLKTKKIEDKENKTVKITTTTTTCGEHIVYGRNANKLIIIEAIMGLMLFLSGFGFAYSNVPEFKDKVDNFIIETFNIDPPTAPEITGGSETYAKERIIKIVKDAKSNSGISHYEYCISSSKDMNKCKWLKTTTKNVVVNINGVYYVAFRGVSKEGNKGNISNIEVVKIDTISPVIEEYKASKENGKVKINIKATDNVDTKLKYYYKVDDGNYIEVDEEFELEIDGTHKVTIRVEDQTGNYIEVEKEIDFDEIKGVTPTPEEETNDPIGNDEENTPENPEQPNVPENPKEEEKIEVPEINLDKVPTTFEYKEKYEVPSYYKFDSKGGEVICLADGKEIIKDTSKLRIGKHLITCEAIGNNGYTTRVEKEVEVTLIDVEEEIWDGYIILTLYYPENSTDWQWRLGNENEIRTGYDNTGWQDYVGPIKVKLEDVSNVYIKYKLGEEEIIEAPNGKMVVDIRPDNYTIDKNAKTKVTIYYDKTSTKNEYRVNEGTWKKYDGTFEVGPNTIIEARASKTEKVYDEDGNLMMEYPVTTYDTVFISEYIPVDANPNSGYSGSIGGMGFGPSGLMGGGPSLGGGHTAPSPGSKPIYSLEGPNIIINPETLVEKVNVEITTEEEARSVYYSVNEGAYKEYTGSFELTSNGSVRAYYIRKSDGKVSDTTTKEIYNIKKPDMPYVRIDADPHPYFEKNTEKVTVSIVGSDYDTIEYSLDGIYYQNYIGSFELTQASTVYAKATNENGTTYEKLVINNLPQITMPEELEVEIINTDLYDNGLATASTIKIVYDSRATTKLYKVGSNDSWHEYTGEFTINKNATIYAYCRNDNGYGEKEKIINSLYTGMVDPVINAKPKNNLKTTSTKVEIEYDKNAITKSYRIGNGELKPYTSAFEVYENTVIYAESYDSLGNRTYAIYQIDNIVPQPEVFVLDKGMYYLIRLNYPTTSSEGGREYKWKVNGEWKVYPSDGIILIKQQYKDEVLGMKDGDVLKLRDENGKETIFTGDYYVLDMPASKMVENLFMRWDTVPPKSPEIVVEPTTWTSEAVVKINYPDHMKKKQYKIIYEDGTTTGWKEYDKAFKVDKNNTTIYAKCQDELEVYSKIAEKTITNIDNGNPGVRYINVVGTTQKSITIQIDGLDSESGIKEYYYSIDGKNYKVSKTNKIIIDDLYANSEYKINVYVVDNAGNEGEVYEVIGKTRNILAPEISFEPGLNEWSTKKTLTLTHEDTSLDLYYSKNKGKTWIIYEGPVELDRNTTIIAKSSDGKNEGLTAIYNIETIDTTKPEIEDIYVLERSSRFIVSVNAKDQESGIKEYYFSIDGENYTKVIENKYQISDLINETEYTIYVKVMNNAGIISEVKTIKAKTTEIGPIGYFVSPDNDTWAYEKEVEIDYPMEEDQGYINEYSLDGGKTWLEYADPVLIETEAQTIIARVIDGSNVKVANSFKVTKIDRTEPTLNLNLLPDTFYTSDTYDLPSAYTVDETKSGGKASCFVNGVEYTNANQLPAGSYTLECKAVTGAGKETTMTKDVNVIHQETLKSTSILKAIQDNEDLETGYYAIEVNAGEETITYATHLYVLDGNQTITEDTPFGDANDVATATEMAKRMVIVKVNGDLTVTETGTLRPYYDTNYGGPKGFMIYVTGKLTNNGIIDNSHGAKAAGQNVYLWKNEDGTYEYISATGGSSNTAGAERQTGGGGTGYKFDATPGAGGMGTSYSGGAGGGGNYDYSKATAGSDIGGAGGLGIGAAYSGGGGAGNPGGLGGINYKLGNDTASKGSNGTGGLLIIYASVYENNGTLTANGSAGGRAGRAGGGGSGAGSINVFVSNNIVIPDVSTTVDIEYTKIIGKITTTGGAGGYAYDSASYANAGGTGTINVGKIISNQYYDLKKVIQKELDDYSKIMTRTGDSILSILKNEKLKNEYYIFEVNDEKYMVHLYVLDGNQTITEDIPFGDANDVASETRNAKQMVVVKVNGDLDITETGTLRPYFDPTYGGPKGFMVYVTGKLTNNGIIDNSHGAKAEGQNVYLWKNADGTYEYVPAVGAGSNTAGTQRQTGGGGSGRPYSATAGAGGIGTSYSGGPGGGGAYNTGKATAGSDIGGAGGLGIGAAYSGGGGAGNPGGLGGINYKLGNNTASKGANGTGGLLIIYASVYENNANVTANGSAGGRAGRAGGGGSGGGSINVFYNKLNQQGNNTVNGGAGGYAYDIGSYANAGGNGTVTYTQIQ